MPAIVDVRPDRLRFGVGVVVMTEVYRNFRSCRAPSWHQLQPGPRDRIVPSLRLDGNPKSA